MLRERQDVAVVVRVVVRVAGDDVQIGAAQPDGLDAHEHLVRARRLHGDVAHLDACDVDEHGGAHRGPRRRAVALIAATAGRAAATPAQAAPSGYAYSSRLSGRIVML